VDRRLDSTFGEPVMRHAGAVGDGPEYYCADDRQLLEPVTDAPGVVGCPSCGHRTDAPGRGVLADGFDVVLRQWGTRGDPHAWRSLRELVGDTPTPATAELIRAAFVDGLTRVTGVDVDTVPDTHVHIPHLDHGGMSGGVINPPWWRERGLPLLVERATRRRPVARRPPPGNPLVTVLIWVLVMAIPAALIGGGGFLLYQRAYGTRVEATVLECDLGRSGIPARYGGGIREDCVARWTIDGAVVIGGYNGGSAADVGTTVDATVRGDTAYSRSLGLPLLLIALGLPFLALPVAAFRHRRRAPAAAGVALTGDGV
jgi:hypothetical protein